MGRKRGRRRSAFKLKLKKDTLNSLVSVFFIGLGLLVIVSFAGQGVWLAPLQKYLSQNFGIAMLLLPFLLIAAGLMLTPLKLKITRPNVFLGAVLIFITTMGLLRSGVFGREINANLSALVHPIGAMILLGGIALAGFLILTESSLDELILIIMNAFGRISGLGSKVAKVKPLEDKAAFADKKRELVIRQTDEIDGASSAKKAASPPPPPAKLTPADNGMSIPHASTKNLPGSSPIMYQPPSIDLLEDKVGGEADRGDMNANAQIIEDTLTAFGVKTRVVEVIPGPAVTQYALDIATGTKLSRITNLQNDLARALSSPTGQIRIEAPIPGKPYVGVEIPNYKPAMVSLKKVLTAKNFKKNKSKLAVGLGLNVSGEVVVADIAKMPHVLIAGATGSGKSVAINAFILQIIYRASPDEVKFILVDPKRVELTQYNSLPHLMTPVIVDPEKVVAALSWAVKEMEDRYKTFAEVGVRNIENYNELSGFQNMPYIIIIIDELADIMLFAPNKVEDMITRLAQMARATGIHLLLATQRPSVDVLTGLIKANIPCRLAFNVTSMVDSRVIIDSPGAEKLLGRGDMLYIPPDQAKPTRIQGTYVTEVEMKRIIDYLKNLNLDIHFTEEVTTQFATRKIVSDDGKVDELDDMFDEAVRIITKQDKASASLLQRRLSIGYARAARILDQMEKVGIVGEASGSKPREVLIKDADAYFQTQSASNQ